MTTRTPIGGSRRRMTGRLSKAVAVAAVAALALTGCGNEDEVPI